MLASDGSDEDWVRRAQAGDRKAFSERVRRHQDREMLNPEQRKALAELLLKQDSPNSAGAQPLHAR